MANKKWFCLICGFIYDEAKGWPDEGIPPGTAWEAVPDDWLCPECLVGKADFEMVEMNEDQAATCSSLLQNSTASAVETKLLPVVIIGSGHSGYSLAVALRAQYPALPITIFTEDSGAIYSKPALSCALAAGKTATQLHQSTALEWEKKLNIRLYPHTQVRHIDRQNQRLETSIGPCDYGRLVLATGASPITPAIAGATPTFLSVNHLHDYARFRQDIAGQSHITILGDGLIGCEFAHDLATSGFKVTVVGLGRWPMSTFLPQPVGVGLQNALCDIGVTWHLNTTIVNASTSIDGSRRLTLSNGETLHTDRVLSATGLRPNVALAQQCNLNVQKGICVNRYGQTNDEAIFALGDCAEYPCGWRPYIAPINQAIPALVRSLTGTLTPIDLTPCPVIVKTPTAPLCFSTPLLPGEWRIEYHDNSIMALHYDDNDMLSGFALFGAGIQQQRNDWMTAVLHTSARKYIEEER
ncbi:FAD-dependent oxidoreductase [Rahnella woolbedingensis]|uniref:Rubredoxin-NAD(+) reductase n=1 Tax=Rahnella woolbedingensis TaxID=1510574 RepID=A0A419N2D0_9GAMM|nr:FAD-dependent oxidoreductase [Rahnella woolbedingensis]RJT34209.1 rubredoxin-NAD(+) reductase [Rahnella woolbedingensis]